MGKIYAAKTNHITNPLGFYLKPLVFSWKVKGGRGQEQKHARMLSARSQNRVCQKVRNLKPVSDG